ncbi:MAG TPA: hypothetical protein PLX89_07715 [Verrucomicrobiota bacterium]|nr:hypothetical protein [Verrucomicrobiales bacterium]HRI12876.1 hypothetical protein [Verrucomicrobiota bacterium]
MAATNISNLWTPAIWINAANEGQATFANVVNSRAVIDLANLTQLATGGGTSGNVPTWKDITDGDEEIQVESTAATVGNITTVNQNVPILNRQKAWGATALSAGVSGSDPIGQIGKQLGASRSKRQQKIVLALLRGAFAGLGAAGASAALSAVRSDLFIEAGNSATSANLISADAFINAKALLGELGDTLQNGAIFMHSAVRAALEKLDASSFKSGVQSGLPFTVKTYKDIPVFTCDALVRAGTTNGYVYETYILAEGVIGRGQKPQSNNVGDVASLVREEDGSKNDVFLYDRQRLAIHLNGMIWGGTPAGQSATNAELGTAASWTLAYTTANRVGAVLLRTNG